jgi:hypothetical protein
MTFHRSRTRALIPRLIESFRTSTDGHNVGSAVDEADCQRPADPRARAGNDYGLAFGFRHFSVSSDSWFSKTGRMFEHVLYTGIFDQTRFLGGFCLLPIARLFINVVTFGSLQRTLGQSRQEKRGPNTLMSE